MGTAGGAPDAPGSTKPRPLAVGCYTAGLKHRVNSEDIISKVCRVLIRLIF